MSIVILTDSLEFSKQLERTLKKILRSHLEINTDFLVPVSFQNFYTICQNNFIDSIIDSIFIDNSIAKKNQSALNQIWYLAAPYFRSFDPSFGFCEKFISIDSPLCSSDRPSDH